MESSFEKQVVSDVPALLARLLEMPEDHVKVRPGAQGSGPDFVLSAGEHTFHVQSRSSSARAPLIQVVTWLKERRGDKERNAIPLLVVPYMGETGRRFCDERELAWLDLSGNAHIKAPGHRLKGDMQFFRF